MVCGHNTEGFNSAFRNDLRLRHAAGVGANRHDIQVTPRKESTLIGDTSSSATVSLGLFAAPDAKFSGTLALFTTAAYGYRRALEG
jgi:hypothetical protein